MLFTGLLDASLMPRSQFSAGVGGLGSLDSKLLLMVQESLRQTPGLTGVFITA